MRENSRWKTFNVFGNPFAPRQYDCEQMGGGNFMSRTIVGVALCALFGAVTIGPALAGETEDLARAALKEKAGAQEAAILIETDLEVIDHNLEKLSGDISQLQNKLVDAKTRQKALIVRGRTAQTRMGVKRQIHDVDNDEGKAVKWDFDETGLLCGIPTSVCGSTAEWHETVSKSGNAKLTCTC